MCFVEGVISGLVKIHGRTRFLLEVATDRLTAQFQNQCEYLKKYHDDIHVDLGKTKTIITVNCGAFIETGSSVSGNLSATLHHLADKKPIVVWSLENVKIL